MSAEVLVARSLAARFCANTGRPQRVGMLWPPRLMVHDVTLRDGRDRVVVYVCAWFRHHLRSEVQVILRPGDEPAMDNEGRTIGGVEVEPTSLKTTGSSARVKVTDWQHLSIRVHWDRRFAVQISNLKWVRKELLVELTDGRIRRKFRWYLYLTPSTPTLGMQGVVEHAHFQWINSEGPMGGNQGVATHWLQVPPPLSNDRLNPGCWVQPDLSNSDQPRAIGPDEMVVVPVFPTEPALPSGLEAIGWDGALGGPSPRPTMQSLAVSAEQLGNKWHSWLELWDSNGIRSTPRRLPTLTSLDTPIACTWPEIECADSEPLRLFDLVGREGEHPCEVLVNIRVRLRAGAEALTVHSGELRLGREIIGYYGEGEFQIAAGQERNLRCTVDLAQLTDATDGRLRFSLVLQGAPARGVSGGSREFVVQNGPFAMLTRSRLEGGHVRCPWLVVDLGTEGTSASVAFLDGYVPRVINCVFDDGPIHPSRVDLQRDIVGSYGLSETKTLDGLYTTVIKLGLRFGDGAHPGCPDHIAATEVARFFLKRFLLEVRRRMAWFPLTEADVLISFPPRLAAMPRFVRSLRETFDSVLREVVWEEDRPKRLMFREEGLLVAVPWLYKDFQKMTTVASRYIYVLDFGGGTTDVCGFLCRSTEDDDEQRISNLSYPQRLSNHLSGNDVTRAYYLTLLALLRELGIVPYPGSVDDSGRQFVFPVEAFPQARLQADSLLNQAALRELADALKCTSRQHWKTKTVASLAKKPTRRIVSVDGQETTLYGLLSNEGLALGGRTAFDLFCLTLNTHFADPMALHAAKCKKCSHEVSIPNWAFDSSGWFRLPCTQCGHMLSVPQPKTSQWQDRPVTTQGLELSKDNQVFSVPDIKTLRRWVTERRVGPEDQIRQIHGPWQRLADMPELADVFDEPEQLGVDITQEAHRNAYREDVFPEAADPTEGGLVRPSLARDLRLFLNSTRQSLAQGLAAIPGGENAELTILVAGRASQFAPLIDGIRAFLPGEVCHMTNEWVRRNFGHVGAIDGGADLKTLTVNGGGLFALLQSHPETSPMTLTVDTQRIECPVYLKPLSHKRPWLLTTALELRPGKEVLLAVSDSNKGLLDAPSARALPTRTPLTGELTLVIDGLPEDRKWEPYVTIARGMARRHHGRRSRTRAETKLRTEYDRFVLHPLTQDQSLEFVRMLPRLPLLGDTE